MTAESLDMDAALPSRRRRLAVLGFGYVSATVAERALSCGLLSIGCPKVAQHSPLLSWLLAQLQAFLLELWMFPAGLVYLCAMVGSAIPALANLAPPLGDWSAFSAHVVYIGIGVLALIARTKARYRKLMIGFAVLLVLNIGGCVAGRYNARVVPPVPGDQGVEARLATPLDLVAARGMK